MNKIYYDILNPAGFSSVSKLVKASKKKKKKVQDWLSSQTTYTLHKPVRRKFKTYPTITYGIGDLYQGDLVEMQKFKDENNNFRYLLTIIDCFSKYATAIPLKTKSAANVKEALITAFSKMGKPFNFQTDQGKEFVNSTLQKYLKDEGVNFYTTNSQFKASIVERFNRTLKTRMWKIFTKRKNKKWVNSIDSLIKSYNNSFHRSIGMKPKEVNKTNEINVFTRLFPRVKLEKPTFRVGDFVRISRHKAIFDKGYEFNWTPEVFKVDGVYRERVPIMYRISDLKGDVIKGSFYKQELQKVTGVLPIKKIHREKIVGGKKLYLVEWIGYKKKSWIEDIF